MEVTSLCGSKIQQLNENTLLLHTVLYSVIFLHLV